MSKPALKSKRMIRQGLLYFFGGLAITIGTQSLVSERGGMYLICWGPVIWGGIQCVRGFSIAGTPEDSLEDESTPTVIVDNTCPACKQVFKKDPDYCPSCGRYLRA